MVKERILEDKKWAKERTMAEGWRRGRNAGLELMAEDKNIRVKGVEK